jgi:hypothetical protein
MKCYEIYDYFKANQRHLKDADWLTEFLRPHCHFILQGLSGSNLRLLQCPWEFAEFLIFMGAKKVSRYLEIGVSSGGSFFMADSYLRAVNPDFKFSVGCDKSNAVRDLNLYRARFPQTVFRQTSSALLNLGQLKFDLAFIDACHAEEWVLHDFKKVHAHCRLVAFHDIVLPKATVRRAWQKIKEHEGRHWEFIDHSLEQTLGIGVVTVKHTRPGRRQSQKNTIKAKRLRTNAR